MSVHGHVSYGHVMDMSRTMFNLFILNPLILTESSILYFIEFIIFFYTAFYNFVRRMYIYLTFSHFIDHCIIFIRSVSYFSEITLVACCDHIFIVNSVLSVYFVNTSQFINTDDV